MTSDSTFPRMHVSLYVTDIAQTVNFYTSFFGVPATKIRKGYAKYVLDKPSLIISFVENPDRVQQNFGHLGFQVETLGELNEQMAHAEKRGLISKKEIGTNCCFAKQDKFWANDPDGVQWEVYYFHEDAEFNDPHYEMSESSACCSAPTNKVATNTLQVQPPHVEIKTPIFKIAESKPIDKVACGCGVESECC